MNPHLTELHALIERAPSSLDYLPVFLTAKDLERPAVTNLNLLGDILKRTDVPLETIPWYQYLQQGVSNGYAQIREGQVQLLPVINPPNLLHRGVFDEKTIHSLQEQGVFGNPNSRYATYLSSSNWSGETYSEMEDRSKIVILQLNTSELLRRRSVFIDPESLNEYCLCGNGLSELGKMFFVLGGIPKEAISDLWFPYS